MALMLKDSVVYAVRVHNRQATRVRGLSLYGKVLHASAEDAKAAEGEARATGEFDEVAVWVYCVAAPGGSVRPGTVTVKVDPRLGGPVLYMVEGHGDSRVDGHWFEMCGDAVYATEGDALALQMEARASGKYDEVIVLAYPVVESGEGGGLS